MYLLLTVEKTKIKEKDQEMPIFSSDKGRADVGITGVVVLAIGIFPIILSLNLPALSINQLSTYLSVTRSVSLSINLPISIDVSNNLSICAFISLSAEDHGGAGKGPV